ncbi:hypothetical protein TTHERM_00329810 (macronuclear) [Tetrahymena thermophila SB210]|uniref:Uncharacterized protein n=1 Tax=Tetrahymena thermophila (strain SB210) TaxID=312017 RepID=I7MJJ0_TETTS|nr:hypothetical protein TTHERM_00329810 [Tetrahymena thermophila SB210]EAS06301.1 hypothetical protein TTHERM_00329810 [Tetrahymena thermophila SB210]|eukprot:XP_001026546.1 hypothetical protein TTHERM_00329810 [Tetrahymena thermophila SB210]
MHTIFRNQALFQQNVLGIQNIPKQSEKPKSSSKRHIIRHAIYFKHSKLVLQKQI